MSDVADFRVWTQIGSIVRAAVTSVSCGSPGNCAADGYYFDLGEDRPGNARGGCRPGTCAVG